MTDEAGISEEMGILSSFHLGIAIRSLQCVVLARINPFPHAVESSCYLPVLSIRKVAKNISPVPASDFPNCWIGIPPAKTSAKFFIELLEGQWSGVSSVLAAPPGATGFHVDGRMPYGPDLLSHITSNGRHGDLNEENMLVSVVDEAPMGADEEEPEEPVTVLVFPTHESRERATATRKSRLSTVKATPGRRQTATAFPRRTQGASQWVDTTCGCDRPCAQRPPPGLDPPSPVRYQHTADIVGNSRATWNRDGLRQSLLEKPKTSHILSSPPAKVRTMRNLRITSPYLQHSPT